MTVTDNGVVRFDGTSGTSFQDSGITVPDGIAGTPAMGNKPVNTLHPFDGWQTGAVYPRADQNLNFTGQLYGITGQIDDPRFDAGRVYLGITSPSSTVTGTQVTKLKTAAATNDTDIELETLALVEVGKTVAMQLDDGSAFVSEVDALPGGDVVTMADALPSAASKGTQVTISPASLLATTVSSGTTITVENSKGMAGTAGDVIRVKLDDGTWHVTTLAATPTNQTLSLSDAISSTASAGNVVTLNRRDVNPALALYRNTQGPIAQDTLGQIMWIGRTDDGGAANYAQIVTYIKDPAAGNEAGHLSFATTNANRFDISEEGFRAFGLGWPGEGWAAFNGLKIGSTTVFDGSARLQDGQRVYLADNSSSVGPTFTLQRASADAAIGDGLGVIYWQGSNDIGETVTGAQVNTIWTAVADGAESMHLQAKTMEAGTFATRASWGAGQYMAGAVGGDRGAGTINATAVYDDNALLTCYVLEGWLDGAINLERWDETVPDRVDECGNVEIREHDRARGFATVMADRLDTDALVDWVKENRRLPAFPGPDHWRDRHDSKMAAGDVVQRLWETVELLFVHLAMGHERTKALEGRVAELERGRRT